MNLCAAIADSMISRKPASALWAPCISPPQRNLPGRNVQPRQGPPCAMGNTVRSISSLADNHPNSFPVAVRVADKPDLTMQMSSLRKLWFSLRALRGAGLPPDCEPLAGERHAILPRMRLRFLVNSLILILALAVLPLNARVIRVEIASRTDVLNGKAFGDAGAYERITGRVYFSLATANPHNMRIVDLGNAVNLKNGEVEFSSDFVAIRPKDAQKGNGSMLLGVPNRGRGRIVGLVDGGDWDLAHDAGDAWLLRNGFTVVSLGWQWDATGPSALRFFAPIAKDHGKTITGLLRGDLMLAEKMTEIPLGHFTDPGIGGNEYPVASPDDARNVLTVRSSREAQRTIIPRTDWQFAHTVQGKL